MDFEEYMKTQLAERYRCFIFCGAGLTGKTDRMKKVVKTFGGRYVDVLQFFSEDPPKQAIETLRPEQFLGLFKIEEDKLLVFDNIDFLFSLWTENQQKEFIRKLDKKSNGCCLIAVLHNYKILDEIGLMQNNSKGQKRIVNIAEFM